MNSLEKLQERGLRFVYNNYTTPYVDLLRKAHIPSFSTAWHMWTFLGRHTYPHFPLHGNKCSYWSLQGLEWSITQVHALYVHTKQKITTIYVLITKFSFRNVTPQIMALNHFHTRLEVYGINYQTVLEHVSHWKILRQRFSLGQLTCNIYILHWILACLAFVDLTCSRFYVLLF